VNDVTFDLNGMSGGEIPKGSEKWQGETNFPDPLGAGSFRPNSLDFFFVDPSVKAKYSKIWSVPAETTFLMLHCHFIYPPRPLSYGPDGPSVLSHTAERTICLLPAESRVKTEDKV
jgi:hypothetical protein